jgi:hypothetical protein
MTRWPESRGPGSASHSEERTGVAVPRRGEERGDDPARHPVLRPDPHRGEDGGAAAGGARLARAIVIAPPGVPHKFTNDGPGPSSLVCIHANPTMVTEWLE